MTLRKIVVLAALAAAVVWMGTGCEDGGSDDGGGSSRDEFVGGWRVTKLDTGSVGYYYFQEDGTFYKTREEPDGPVHLTGTWTVSDGTLHGPFTNPGVGEGEVVATVSSDGVMSMDFIEKWYDPYKVVPCSGTKID